MNAAARQQQISEALELIKNGAPASDVATKYHVSLQTVYGWSYRARKAKNTKPTNSKPAKQAHVIMSEDAVTLADWWWKQLSAARRVLIARQNLNLGE